MKFLNKELNSPGPNKSPDVVSANDLPRPARGNADLSGGSANVTGATTINGIASSPIGTQIMYQFDGALILKHDTAASAGFDSIDMPGNVDRTTVAGDIILLESQGAGNNYRALNYQGADGQGTWTPTIQDSSANNGEGQTYNIQEGTYTKIGNRVFFQGLLQITSLGTLTTSDAALLAGFPFAANSSANKEGGFHVFSGAGLAITANSHITGIMSVGQTRAVLREWNQTSGDSSLLLSELTASGIIQFEGQYIT